MNAETSCASWRRILNDWVLPRIKQLSSSDVRSRGCSCRTSNCRWCCSSSTLSGRSCRFRLRSLRKSTRKWWGNPLKRCNRTKNPFTLIKRLRPLFREIRTKSLIWSKSSSNCRRTTPSYENKWNSLVSRSIDVKSDWMMLPRSAIPTTRSKVRCRKGILSRNFKWLSCHRKKTSWRRSSKIWMWCTRRHLWCCWMREKRCSSWLVLKLPRSKVWRLKLRWFANDTKSWRFMGRTVLQIVSDWLSPSRRLRRTRVSWRRCSRRSPRWWRRLRVRDRRSLRRNKRCKSNSTKMK